MRIKVTSHTTCPPCRYNPTGPDSQEVGIPVVNEAASRPQLT